MRVVSWNLVCCHRYLDIDRLLHICAQEHWFDESLFGRFGMKMIWLGITILVLPISHAAFGQSDARIEAQYSRYYNDCINSGDAAQGITVGILDCNGAEIDRQDARLNQAYKMVMMRLNVAQKAKLRISERTWIGKRDARCRAISASEESGTFGAILYSNCILSETTARRMWLESYKP